MKKLKNLLKILYKQLDGLDILVNNAGITLDNLINTT